MATPPAKKQKTGEEAAAEPEAKDAEMKEEEKKPAVPEPPKELEEDAPACKKPKNTEAAQFLVQDTTLNLMQSASYGVLTSLREGGMQHLLAGARANLGVSKGRYMFEVKILENLGAGEYRGGFAPRFALHLGFGTADSNLFVGDAEDTIGFDGFGSLLYNKTRTKGARRVPDTHGTVLAVVLNLEAGHANFNTVSLFANGLRISQPQQLPESLKGKALYPMVSFKHATIHVNCGPVPLAPLPFTCRMVSDAVNADVTVAKATEPADGKYEVVFPIGIPDEGTFDRLDLFIKKHPKYLELSDRMIMEWVAKSGIRKHAAKKGSNDKPEKQFGVRELDDDSARRAMYAMAPLQPRNYVVMEVKSNLIADERKALLERFSGPMFKKVADIGIGEATADYKKAMQAMILREKQEKSDKMFRLQQEEKKRKKAIEKKQKETAKAKKKAEKEAKKRVEAMKAKAEAAKKKAEAEKAGKKEDEEEKKEEEKEDDKEEEEEEEDEEPEEPEEPEQDPPKVTLDVDEKTLVHRPVTTPDLAPLVMSANFAQFSLPEESEGFDHIRYDWSKGAKADEYLKQWKISRKTNSRVEELRPSAWFHQRVQQWQQATQEWRQKVSEWKTQSQKKMKLRETKKSQRLQAMARLESQAKASAAKPMDKRTEKDAEMDKKREEEKAELEKQAAEAEAAEEQEKDAEEEAEKAFLELDIFGADDVNDVAGGIPLYRDFQSEDWTLMQLVFELNLLVHAFTHDVADPERPGVHVDHLGFYFKKYFNKELRPKDYGVESVKELCEIVDDKVLYFTADDVLASQLDGEFETPAVLPKVIEAARRYRRLRIDLGEKGAALKLSASAGQGGSRGAAGGGGGGGGGHQGWQNRSGGYGPAAPQKFGKGSHPYGGKTGGGKGWAGGKR